MRKEVIRFKGKRDKFMLCVSKVGKLDFKKLQGAASRKIDSKDQKHVSGRILVESQTSQNHVW